MTQEECNNLRIGDRIVVVENDSLIRAFAKRYFGGEVFTITKVPAGTPISVHSSSFTIQGENGKDTTLYSNLIRDCYQLASDEGNRERIIDDKR
jgi:hypothetical protein